MRTGPARLASAALLLAAALQLSVGAMAREPLGSGDDGPEGDASLAPPQVASLGGAPGSAVGPTSGRLAALDGAARRAIRNFYRNRDYQPLWFRDGEQRAVTSDLVTVLAEADRHGLRPDDYDARALRAALDSPDPARLARLDLWLTRAVTAYAVDMSGGRVDHPPLRGGRTAPDGSLDVAAFLDRLAGSDTPERELRQLAPSHAGYEGLQRALAAYREVAAAGGWEPIPEGVTLQAGMRNAQVPYIRARLDAAETVNPAPRDPRGRHGPFGQAVAAGETSGFTGDPLLYTRELADRVRAFQKRHGLAADGMVGTATRAAMNVPVSERIEEITLNMERWRWLPATLGWRYIKVNIPAFELEAVYEGQRAFRMDVVVGKPERPTPSFSHHIRYMAMNPDWTIPNSIAVRDIVPEILEDEDYLDEHNITVYESWRDDAPAVDPSEIDWEELAEEYEEEWEGFPYQLRQDPGETNPLGYVKFMFPNPQNIYLHDTPNDYEFARRERMFSSGCVRVRDPDQLAAHLLDRTMTPDEAEAARKAAGDSTRVDLDHPIPVHLVYHTAWVDSAGRVQFRADVYDRNAELAAQLQDARTPASPRDTPTVQASGHQQAARPDGSR